MTSAEITPSKAQLKFPSHGFGEFEVAEMPAYTQRYSKRGNQFDGDTTPVYQQARWGNKTGKGGMGAYLSQAEDDGFFGGTKVKLGDQGVFSIERWSPGYDWRGGFGVASLSNVKNYAGISTRGGQLRKGAPKRGDYMERKNAWFEKTMPGISHGRYTQKNDNYAGLYEWKRRTPIVQRENDMLVLREQIEHNPFHISSHSAKQAKTIYDKEFQEMPNQRVKAYNDNLDALHINSRKPVVIKETNRYMLNRP